MFVSKQYFGRQVQTHVWEIGNDRPSIAIFFAVFVLLLVLDRYRKMNIFISSRMQIFPFFLQLAV